MSDLNSKMRSLKIQSKFSGLFLLLLCTTYANAQNRLDIHQWGIESGFHKELRATAEQHLAGWPETRRGQRLYRYFTVKDNAEYDRLAQELMNRHLKVWALYEKTLANRQEPNKDNYLNFAKTKDPYFIGLTERLSPVLYFDFRGMSGKEYILDSIIARTISFEEYSGAGFSQNEAWYDILLKHRPGARTFRVDRKLRFTGSGRASLRLWSDNYYPNVGTTPMGCYMIEITFNFIVDGQNISVKTGAFKIDV